MNERALKQNKKIGIFNTKPQSLGYEKRWIFKKNMKPFKKYEIKSVYLFIYN